MDVPQTVIHEDCQHTATATYVMAPKVSMQSVEELWVNTHVTCVPVINMKPQHLNVFLL